MTTFLLVGITVVSLYRLLKEEDPKYYMVIAMIALADIILTNPVKVVP